MMVYGFKSISLQSIEVQVWVNIQNSGANGPIVTFLVMFNYTYPF